MRNILILIMLFSNILKAQDKILTYEEVINKEYLKTISDDETIKGFIISTGDTVKVNQLIEFGKPNNNRPIYNAIVNREINNYTSIFLGKPDVKTILRFQYFPEGYENKEAKIISIVGKK
jgi:hypothetical protein